MKRYNLIKRKYTKRRNKTKNRCRNKTKKRRFVKRNKTKKRRFVKRNKTKKIYKGGYKNAKFNCVNGMCKYDINGEYSSLVDCILDCHPPIPPVPPPMPSIDSLKLISNYHEIKLRKLYMLTDTNYPIGDIIFLFIPSEEITYKDKQVIEDDIIYYRGMISVVEREGKYEIAEQIRCSLKLYEKYISYFDDITKYDHRKCLFYKKDGIIPGENDLCMLSRNSNLWHLVTASPSRYLSKPLFNYISTKYNIYEFDEWPKELPRIPDDLDQESKFVHIPFGEPLRLKEDNETTLPLPSTHYG